MKQHTLPGFGAELPHTATPALNIINDCERHYTALIRTEPGIESEIDQQFPITEIMGIAGATNITGGYDDKLGAWTYVFDLAYETASSVGVFTRNMAEQWCGPFCQEHNALYMHIEVSWYKDGQHVYGIALDSLDLARLKYEAR